MNKTQSEINPHQIAASINNIIEDIHENFDPEKLNEEERDSIYEQLVGVHKLALDIKAKLNAYKD